MASRIQTFTVSNKKTFPAGTDGRRLVTLTDLEDISKFTITADQAIGPTWVSVNVTYATFSTADTTNEVTIYQLPMQAIVHACIVKTTQNFAGTGITDYDISVGISGNATKYCAAVDVDSGATGNLMQTTLLPESWLLDFNIKATATSSGANLDQANAGSATIYLLVSELE